MNNETAEEMTPLIICLVEDRHVTCEDWVAWATDELMRCDCAPAWLAELTTTYSIDQALKLLSSLQHAPTVQDRLRSLWLTFVADQVTSTELLELALEAAGGWDTGGGFIPYQRERMALLQHVDRLATTQRRETLEDIERDAVALLSALGNRVRERVGGRIAMTGRAATER